MNDGLDDPDYPLMDRSYNACHFWCYLGQRAGNEQTFIEEVWANFEVNGKDLKDAVDSTIKSMIKSSYNLDIMATQWLFTNASKDYINVPAVFDYEEDEWVLDCGTETYVPEPAAEATSATARAMIIGR